MFFPQLFRWILPRSWSSKRVPLVLKPKSLLSAPWSTLRFLGCFIRHSKAPSPSATVALNLFCSCRSAGGAEAFLLVSVVEGFYPSPSWDSISQPNKQRLWLPLFWYVLGVQALVSEMPCVMSQGRSTQSLGCVW